MAHNPSIVLIHLAGACNATKCYTEVIQPLKLPASVLRLQNWGRNLDGLSLFFFQFVYWLRVFKRSSQQRFNMSIHKHFTSTGQKSIHDGEQSKSKLFLLGWYQGEGTASDTVFQGCGTDLKQFKITKEGRERSTAEMGEVIFAQTEVFVAGGSCRSHCSGQGGRGCGGLQFDWWC